MPLVRYWAAAREIAGTVSEECSGTTVSAVLSAVGLRHGPGMAGLLPRCVVLVDGVQSSANDAVGAASIVEVLPPYAGGSR
jgi:molybdopterin synthase catalytic subunit